MWQANLPVSIRGAQNGSPLCFIHGPLHRLARKACRKCGLKLAVLDEIKGIGTRCIALVIPVGRQLSEVCHDLRKYFEGPVDVFLRGVSAQAEAHGPVNCRKRDFHRPQDM